jgi:hypothetical protein
MAGCSVDIEVCLVLSVPLPHFIFVVGRHPMFTASVHFFTFFMPYFVMLHRRFVQISAVALFLTGPLLASFITSSVNEQPAVWCFSSIFQAVLFSVAVRYMELHKQPVLDTIHHAGGYGEKPLAYKLMEYPENLEKQLLLGDEAKMF